MFPLIVLNGVNDCFPFLNRRGNKFKSMKEVVHIEVKFSPLLEGEEIDSAFLLSTRADIVKHNFEMMLYPHFINQFTWSFAKFPETHD